jgi:hypothetical protein
MRPITPPPDSGTQPAPHYCTVGAVPGGGRTGCPDWPLCIFPMRPLPAGRTLTLTKPVPAALADLDDDDDDDDDDEPEPDDDDEVPGIAVTLAAVLGYFVGAIVLVGSATLLYLEVF